MFSQNIYLLIGILFFVALAFVALVLSWSGARIAIFRLRQRKSDREVHAARFHEDGAPIPPRGEGLCNRCGRAGFEIYCLPANGRLCESCYGAFRARAADGVSPATPAPAPASPATGRV
jgi:hypothetical protein